jgi:hypothetical protein
MATAQPIIDHDQIRRWAEERDARPACVKGTGGRNDTGMIRLDFPGYSGKRSLQPISWNEWFRQFDANHLALLVQETTARGETSNFNKLVARTSARGRKTAKRRTTAARAGRSRKSTAKSGRKAASASSARKSGSAARKTRARAGGTKRGTKRAGRTRTTTRSAAGGRKRARAR